MGCGELFMQILGIGKSGKGTTVDLEGLPGFGVVGERGSGGDQLGVGRDGCPETFAAGGVEFTRTSSASRMGVPDFSWK